MVYGTLRDQWFMRRGNRREGKTVASEYWRTDGGAYIVRDLRRTLARLCLKERANEITFTW